MLPDVYTGGPRGTGMALTPGKHLSLRGVTARQVSIPAPNNGTFMPVPGSRGNIGHACRHQKTSPRDRPRLSMNLRLNAFQLLCRRAGCPALRAARPGLHSGAANALQEYIVQCLSRNAEGQLYVSIATKCARVVSRLLPDRAGWLPTPAGAASCSAATREGKSCRGECGDHGAGQKNNAIPRAYGQTADLRVKLGGAEQPQAEG